MKESIHAAISLRSTSKVRSGRDTVNNFLATICTLRYKAPMTAELLPLPFKLLPSDVARAAELLAELQELAQAEQAAAELLRQREAEKDGWQV